MEIKLIQLLMVGSVVMLISCNSPDNSALEKTVNELQENQKNIQVDINKSAYTIPLGTLT